jgi:hypothetical protein
MRATLAVAVGLVVLVASLSASANPPGTSLRITYWENGPRRGEPTRWTLQCGPPAGTLARPAPACARLAAAPRRIFAPVPADAVCTEIYGGPQVARIVGRFEFQRVWATFRRTNGCEISRWDGLSPWLLPRGGVR